MDDWLYPVFEVQSIRKVRQMQHANDLNLPNKKSKVFPSGAHEVTPCFSGVRVSRSLALCVCFVDRCLTLVHFGHCVVCSLIYGFRLPLWYPQTLLS